MPSPDQDHPHQPFLQRHLPTWTRHTSAEHWQRLRQTQQPPQGHAGAEADWFANAAPDLREAVLAAQARQLRSARALAAQLRGLQSPISFAAPLLNERLLADFGLALDAQQAQLVEYGQERVAPRHPPRAVARAPVSLLQAAMHNFYPHQGFVSPSYLRASIDASPLQITPYAFASSCRALDLGQRYQAHLHSQYMAPKVAQCWINASQDQLRAALALGRLRQQIRGRIQDRLLSLLDGHAQLMPVQQLRLFDVSLRDVLVFHPDGLGADLPVVVWLPGAAEAELLEYASLAAFTEQLGNQLATASFRQFFLRFVASEQQTHFLSVLKRNLDAGHSALEADWTPRSDADLHLLTQALPSRLFPGLFEQHLQQVYADARQLAVPTADADAARLEEIKSFWKNSALNFLNAAAFFVPGLGEMMMAVAACQLLEELVEGVEAWQVGDLDAALGHVESVALNVAFIAGISAAGKAFSYLSELVEVRLPDGRVRLWKPDLARYQSSVELPPSIERNALGQYVLEDDVYVRIDGRLHAQRFDPELGKWRLLHPSDANAYQPVLEHNGQGAWRSVHEQPLNWSDEQLLRRLGPASEDLSDSELHAAVQISASSHAQLRQLHVANQPPPPLLADTLARLQAARRAGSGEGARQRFDQLYQAPATARLAPAQAARLRSEQYLARALEGLYAPLLASADSDRLLLTCLERLPGWPDSLCLELRGGAVDGPLLERIGEPASSTRRVIVKSTRGYQLVDLELPSPVADELFTAVFSALPEPARSNMALANSTALLDKVKNLAQQQRPLLSQWLWSYPRLARAESGRLRGGVDQGYPPGRYAVATRVARYRRLFPTLSDGEARAALDNWAALNLSVEGQLAQLEAQFTRLQHDLQAWAQDNEARGVLRDEMISVWRQERYRQLPGGERVFQLNLDDIGLSIADLADFPALEAPFAHVRELSLDDNPLEYLPRAFSRHFPSLQRVSLSSAGLQQVPGGLGAGVRVMDLSDNAIVWSADNQLALQEYPRLQELQMTYNPLGTPPDLSHLPDLLMLDLSRCGLRALPVGLAGLRQPQLIDLSINQLERLPIGFMLPTPVSQALRLESNPFDAVTLTRIEQYLQTSGVDLMVADINYDGLLFTANVEQRALWRRLELSVPRPFLRDLRGLYDTQDYQIAPGTTLRRWWRVLGWIETAPANQMLLVPAIARNLLRLEPQVQSALAMAAPTLVERSERLLQLVVERVRLRATQEFADQATNAMMGAEAVADLDREPIRRAFFYYFLQQLGHEPTLVFTPTPTGNDLLSLEHIEHFLQQRPADWLNPVRTRIEQLNPGTQAGLDAIVQRHPGTRLFVHNDWEAMLRQRFAGAFVELEGQYARTLELAREMIPDQAYYQVYAQDLERQYLQQLDVLMRDLTREIGIEPHEE